MSAPRADACLVSDCDRTAEHGAPVALCPVHVEEVADWADGSLGVTDLLPWPCRACGSRLGVRWPTGWQCAICEWDQSADADPDLPRPRIDVVYYLRYQDRVKIGTTVDPRRRFTAIRHDQLLALERGDRRREHERHALFADDRLGTSEWFQLSPRIVEHVETLGGGAVDPWDLWSRWQSEALALRG